MKDDYVENSEARIYYKIEGAGEPLLLVNGNSLDLEMWDPQIGAFAEHFQVIRYDLRGVGNSSDPDKNFSYSEDIYHLLKFLGIEKAHILGLSFGGAFAVDFASEHPEMVVSLILAAAITSDFRNEYLEGLKGLSVVTKEKGVIEAIETLLQLPSFIAPENTNAINKTRENFTRNSHPFENDFPAVRFWQPPNTPIEDRLSKIEAPALIIVGEKDDLSVHEIAESLFRNIKNSQKISVKNAAHMLNLEKPEEFNRIVLNFLQAI